MEEGIENDLMEAAGQATARKSNDESGREAEVRDGIIEVTSEIYEKMMEDGGRLLSSTRCRAPPFSS